MLVLLAAAGVRPAHGQVAEAAVGGEQQFAVGGMVSAFHIDYGKRWLGGEGVYVDANIKRHLGIEGQALWLNQHEESGTHATTFLAGPRYSFNGIGRLRPYAKFLVGEGTFDFPYGLATGHYVVLSPGAGIDFRVSHRIRWRVADFEYQQWPWFTFGSMSSYGVSMGVRYAFR